jgi:hypothetical protein
MNTVRRPALVAVLAAAVLVAAAAAIMDDPYRVMELPRHATQQDIKKQFRRLSKMYHPDVTKTSATDDHYTDVVKAYEILASPQKRAEWDQQRQGGFGFGGGGGGGFAHFQQRQRPTLKPIKSAAPTLDIETWYNAVHYGRGARVTLVLVYHDDDYDCHLFAPGWELALKAAALKRTVDFYVLDAKRDDFLLEVSGLSAAAAPALYAVVDGTHWRMGSSDMRTGASPATMARAVSTFVDGFYAELLSAVKARRVYDKLELEEAVRAQRYRVPLVVVNVGDAKMEETAMNVATAFSGAAHVTPVGPEVLHAVHHHCAGHRQHDRQHRDDDAAFQGLWLYGTTSGALCDFVRYPAFRLHDQEGILQFVRQRLAKTDVPVLTNQTFHALCGVDGDELEPTGPGLCAVQVGRAVPAMSDTSAKARRQRQQPAPASLSLADVMERVPEHFAAKFTAAVVEMTQEPDFAHEVLRQTARVGHPTGQLITLVVFNKKRPGNFRVHVGDVGSAAAFLREAASDMVRRVAVQSRDLGSLLVPDRFPMSKGRVLSQWAEWLYGQIPLANVLLLGILWLMYSALCSGQRTPQPRRAQPQPQPQPQSTQRSTPASQQPRPAPRPQAQAPRPAQPAPSARPAQPASPAGTAPRQTWDAPRRPTSPPPKRTPSPPAPAPAPAPAVALPPGSIPHLSKADLSGPAAKGLLLLVFGTDVMPFGAELEMVQRYPTVAIRSVPRRHRWWWRWLESNSPVTDINGITAARRVYIVVRTQRMTAAIMPPGRTPHLFVDSVLDGTTRLPYALGSV